MGKKKQISFLIGAVASFLMACSHFSEIDATCGANSEIRFFEHDSGGEVRLSLNGQPATREIQQINEFDQLWIVENKDERIFLLASYSEEKYYYKINESPPSYKSFTNRSLTSLKYNLDDEKWQECDEVLVGVN